MEYSEEEKGIGLVLLQRLAKERLPRLLDLQQRVERGELLSDFDIEFLEGCFNDASRNRQHFINHPEPEAAEIVGKVAHLYELITAKALENERSRQ